MSKFKQQDLSKVRTISIKGRKSKVTPKDFARPLDVNNASFTDFVDSLPNILMANQLRDLVNDIVQSFKKKSPVILMMGAHVVKVGLSPIIIDLLKNHVIGHVAMNSAAAIHDVETAMWGHTSEDVAANLMDGSFGMSKETGDFINSALSNAMKETTDGYGEAIAKKILSEDGKHRDLSIIATCYELGIPVTVHAAIGTDIVHQQASMDGAATGELSFRDFKVFVNSVKNLSKYSVVLNVGSAVIMPEIFLKALTVARNLGYKTKGFSTANFDMIRQYRPQMNVVERPTLKHGRGYNFIGHHEIMFPLLAAMIKSKIQKL
jgi:deoxyhypusine synthase